MNEQIARASVVSSGVKSMPVLDVENLKKTYRISGGILRGSASQIFAVDGVSFHIDEGETLGLVGESGCGKSTVARAVMQLLTPSSGSVKLLGNEIAGRGRNMRAQRRSMQMIFQDPFSSLNPRLTAGEIVGEPLWVHRICGRAERKERVVELFRRVGLRPAQMDNYPHQFSGGQRQRIGIARALALDPKLIVCDEPVSALDVSIQAQVLNLMQDLQEEKKLAYLFIAHDLAVVEHISHRVAVMYLGRIVEYADRKSLFTSPQHPYTEALLSAVPIPDPSIERKRILVQGEVPSPSNPPAGCHFHTRCPYAFEQCKHESPPLIEVGPSHWASCHLRKPLPSPSAH